MSKYLDAFSQIAPLKHHTLVGDCLLVEILDEEEFKTSSGIILSSGPKQVNGFGADKPTFVRILLTGEGYYNEDTLESVPLDSKPGDIVLVGITSIKRFSVFGRLVNYGEAALGLIREVDVQMRFNGPDGFDKFFEEINLRLANGKTK